MSAGPIEARPAGALPQSTTEVALGTWLSASIRFGLSVSLAGGATYLIARGLPRRLSVTTDVVGYPIHSNFNIDHYFRVYGLITLFFPLAALLGYHVLTRVERPDWLRRRLPTLRLGPGAPRVAPALALDKVPAIQMGRALLVGSILGSVAAIATGRGGLAYWWGTATVAAGYLFLAMGLAGTVMRGWLPSASVWSRLAVANALMAPVSIVALWTASTATHVVVEAGAASRAYPWMPLWLVGLGLVGALCWVAVRLARARDDEDLRRIERHVVVFVAAPVGLFLISAYLPGALGQMDVFHEGELLVGSTLWLEGRFPWRDFVFAHGVLEDALHAAVGLGVFEDSRWGAAAGQAMVLLPVYWLLLYFLHAYLFRRDWLFVTWTVTIVATGLMPYGFVRFTLMPLVFLLLAALLRRAVLWRAAALTVLLGVQAVLVPEAGYAIPACGAVLVLYEACAYDRTRSLGVNFRRTVLCGAVGLLIAGLWAGYLWWHEALGDFLRYYQIFVPHHRYKGGIPLQPVPEWVVVAPVLSVLVSFWLFVGRARLGRAHSVEDWTMAGAALLVLVYYQKYLSRADGKIFDVIAGVPTLGYYVLYKVTASIEGALQRWRWGELLGRLTTVHVISVILLAVSVAVAPVSPRSLLEGLAARFAPVVPEPPRLERLGYAVPTEVEPVAAALRAALAAHLEPQDALFDFSNQPGMFYYLLRRRPSTRYYHVSMAIPEAAQRDLVAQLERERPKLVAYYNEVWPTSPMGLSAWDGIINSVRHYEVSQYLLLHYRPLLVVKGTLFLARNDLPPSPDTFDGRTSSEQVAREELYFRLPLCDWRYAPNFLGQRGDRGGEGREPVALRWWPVPASAGFVTAIQVPRELRVAGYGVLEIVVPRPSPDEFVLADEPAATHVNRLIAFRTLRRAPSPYRVQVGSCSQWYGFVGDTLYLRHRKPQVFTAIRLSRSSERGSRQFGS